MAGRGPLRASLYVRLSKAADERNLSKQGMVDDLRPLCAAHGFAEVALHVGDGASGGIRNRPAFKAWLAAATRFSCSTAAVPDHGAAAVLVPTVPTRTRTRHMTSG